MALEPGTQLGNYEVLSRIGAGGMGEVYRARDTKLLREVAVKVLPARVASDGERLQRFKREATTVAALNHPNIVTIFGIEESGGHHFLAMELVEGESLSRQGECRSRRYSTWQSHWRTHSRLPTKRGLFIAISSQET